MALLTQSETGHDPAKIRPDVAFAASRHTKKYVPMQQMLRRDVFL